MRIPLPTVTKSFRKTACALGLLVTLPASAQLSVNSDSFESGLTDSNFDGSGITDWTTIDTLNGGLFGTFNPDGPGFWYDSPSFQDTSPSGGEVGTMDGPVSGFLFGGAAGDGFSRDLGLIEGDQQYTATFSISGGRGSATNTEVFHGYTLELFSGSTVLSTVTSNLSPGTFQDVSVVWESDTLPGGVTAGDALSVRILSNGQGDYLDFDNFRVVGTGIPEPTGVSLLALAFVGFLLRKRR